MARRPVGALALAVLVLAGLLPAGAAAFTADPAIVWINEIHYDNGGTDTGEAIEIAGPAGTDLAGWSIALYNGNGGAVYGTKLLSGVIPDQQEGVGTLSFAAAGLQNGSPDGIALVDGSTVVQFLSYEGSLTATSGPAVDLASTDIGVAESDSEPVGQSLQLVGAGSAYGHFAWSGPIAHTLGSPNTGQTLGLEVAPTVSSTQPADGDIVVATDADITVTFNEPVTVAPGAFSVICSTSGAHTAAVSGGPKTFTLDPDVDFVTDEQCTVAVAAANVTDQDVTDPPDNLGADYAFSFHTATACGDPATSIHDIQGAGLASPLDGQVHEIEGVVVGDFQASTSFNGFHVQEEDTDVDADPATSEGIFVFEGASAVEVKEGDVVRVAGHVEEFATFGSITLTELTSVARVLVCSSGASVNSAPVSLPFASPTFVERYESMLVEFDQELTVTETFGLGRFGEVVLSSGGRLLTPTSIVEPGAPAIEQQAANDLDRILLDDGDDAQNIDPTVHPPGGLSAANTLRVGSTIDGGTFVLEQRFNAYRLQPLDAVEFQATNTRPAEPDDVGGTLKVASMNVLNFFTTLDEGEPICGPDGGEDCRGAESELEFERQRAKILAALLGLDADVVGVIEIENNESASLQSLVDGLNEAGTAGTWDFIDTGTLGGDVIKVGFLYRSSTVAPVGDYAILDSSVDLRFDDTLNRPALAQTFEALDGGGRLTAVINHLKSKGSECPGDPDTGDGQGNCNLTRLDAAAALVDWLASDPTGSGDRDVLVIGDLNSYAKEDPIDVFVGAGYTDLVGRFQGEGAYSFVFEGQSGYLDHALASPTLTAQLTGATEWHINADEPPVLDYNTNFKSAGHVETLFAPDQYRSSDHDPLVVGLDLLAFDFDGFRPPVANPPGTTTMKAGRTLPVKFSLGGDFGLDVLFGQPQVFDCEDWPSGASVDATLVGDAGLVYDAAADQYTLEWKTTKAWAGECRTFDLTLVDGTYRTTDVDFAT